MQTNNRMQEELLKKLEERRELAEKLEHESELLKKAEAAEANQEEEAQDQRYIELRKELDEYEKHNTELQTQLADITQSH